jgi:aminopeptidase
MSTILNRYAKLLVNYCLELKKGEKLLIRSTTLAEPLVREIYRETLAVGGIPDTILNFREQNRLLLSMGNEEQLSYISPLYQKAIESYDAFLHIRAPFNLKEDQNVSSGNQKYRQQAMQSLLDTYFTRTGSRDLKRSLCQFPTLASAQAADMSLEEYEEFVFGACKLFEEDPIASWLEVRQQQQRIVDRLAQHTVFRYKNEHTDISFSTEGRTWINSDGQTNMPSGEVYTSPVEHSVNGVIHFTYPAIYQGHEVEGVTLWVKDGLIEKWDAKRGKAFLDHIFSINGARRFGEAAIGTNYNIDKLTKNILFDEKIGGTVHMAIGQSYLQAGGKNVSAVHWDMITDMVQEGVIYADEEIIYEKGRFVF